MVKNYLEILKWLIGAVGAFVVTMASISPEQAGSNIAAWAKVFGWETPQWLAVPSADTWGIWIGSMLVCVAIGWITWPIITRLAPPKAYSNKPSRHPATIVDFNKFEFLPPHEEVEGSPIKLKYYFRNKGQKHAFNVKKSARLLIQSGPFAKEEAIATEKRIFSDFLAKQRHDGGGRKMAVDEEGWDTLGTKPLDAIDVASLKAGKSRLYFIGVITYSDEHGDWESRHCRWYGPRNPEPPHRFSRYCMFNNEVKRPSDW